MIEEKETSVSRCSISVVAGEILYKFATDAFVSEGDVVSAYIEDIAIGSAAIESDCISAKLSLKNFPKVNLPAAIHSTIESKSIILPPVIIDSLDDMMASIAFEAKDSVFEKVYNEQVVCKTTVYSMPEHSRPFSLFLGTKKISSTQSQPVASSSTNGPVLHHIEFNFSHTDYLDGDILRIVDKTSELPLAEFVINSSSLNEILMKKLKRQETEIEQLSYKFNNLERRVAALSTFFNENSVVDRIDMFYFLLNSKIDRILSGHISPHVDSEQFGAYNIDLQNSSQALSIPIGEIEGTGIYSVETNGISEWRWLSPRATIIFKTVPENIGRIQLTFSSKIPNSAKDRIAVSINEFDGQANYAQTEDHWEMEILIASHMKYIDSMLIIKIKFLDYWQADGDDRILSASLTRVQIS